MNCHRLTIMGTVRISDLNTTTPSASARTCWVHWGRTGGGPRFLLELTEGDLHNSGATLLSYNPDAEIAPSLGKLPAQAFQVPTYTSKPGVILGLPRLILNLFRLRRWMRNQNVQRVVGVMENVYQSLALPLIVPKTVEYVACIHDGEHHPGESALVQRLGRWMELRRADRLVAFSPAVCGVLGQKTAKPIAVGSHPPFGFGQRVVTVRDFPVDRPFIFGLFGRLQPYKGVDLLLEAAALLRKDPSVPAFRVKIVGAGPEEYLQNSQLGKEAEWDIRWIPEGEVDSLVNEFDAMVLPYTSASQSGPVTLAIANAIPCVVTPVGALPTQAEGYGAIADDVSPEAIAAAMKSLMNPETYADFSTTAVERLNTAQTWTELAQLIREGGEPGLV